MLLTNFKDWIRTGTRGTFGIPLDEFKSTIQKISHACTCIPASIGLLSPCNWIIGKRPNKVYLHKNHTLPTAIKGCQTLLWESRVKPTRCRELTCTWPYYIGIVDASSHGVRGVVFGETLACTPTVFRWEWPEDIQWDIVSFANASGCLTNSDLKMVRLIILWLVIEGICNDLRERHITLFSDNSPTVEWVWRLASKWSIVAKNLI